MEMHIPPIFYLKSEMQPVKELMQNTKSVMKMTVDACLRQEIT